MIVNILRTKKSLAEFFLFGRKNFVSSQIFIKILNFFPKFFLFIRKVFCSFMTVFVRTNIFFLRKTKLKTAQNVRESAQILGQINEWSRPLVKFSENFFVSELRLFPQLLEVTEEKQLAALIACFTMALLYEFLTEESNFGRKITQ